MFATSKLKIGLIAAALAVSGTLAAEQIKIPVGQQGKDKRISVPYKHMKQDAVLKAYGEPLKVHPTVGEPPITRWDYANFSVFFEYEHTIHAVIRKNGQ